MGDQQVTCACGNVYTQTVPVSNEALKQTGKFNVEVPYCPVCLSRLTTELKDVDLAKLKVLVDAVK